MHNAAKDSVATMFWHLAKKLALVVHNCDAHGELSGGRAGWSEKPIPSGTNVFSCLDEVRALTARGSATTIIVDLVPQLVGRLQCPKPYEDPHELCPQLALNNEESSVER